jgi:hypothetical protein
VAPDGSCLQIITAAAAQGIPGAAANRCPRRGRNGNVLGDLGAGVGIDFHADRDLDDFRCLPSHGDLLRPDLCQLTL